MKFTINRTVAVVAGAAVVVAFGVSGAVAGSLVGSKQIRDGGVRTADLHRGAVTSVKVADHSLRVRDLTDGARTALEGDEGPRGPRGFRGPQGEQGDPASDVFGRLAASGQNDPLTRTWITDVGGTVKNTEVGQGATHVTSIDLEPGTYLVSAYGHFDRRDATQTGYLEPTTDTYGALVLWTGGAQFLDFADAAGTYFTGAISPAGYTEATASGSQILTVTEPTTLHVGGFGYNEDRSGFGSGTDETAQFSVYANVSAVRVAD